SAGVDEACDAGAAGGLEQVPRAVNIGSVDFARGAGPKAIVGGNVKNSVTSSGRAVQRSGITKIAGGALNTCRQGFEQASRTRSTDEHTDAAATSGQQTSNMAAQKAGGTRDQRCGRRNY